MRNANQFAADGLYLCTGACIAGQSEFVAKARVWAKTLGAIPFSNTANALSCQLQLHSNIGLAWGRREHQDNQDGKNSFIGLYGRLRELCAILEEVSRFDWIATSGHSRLRVDPCDMLTSKFEITNDGFYTATDAGNRGILGSTMCHVYLWSGVQGDPEGEVERLESAHARVRGRIGVRLWNRLRGTGHSAAQLAGSVSAGCEQYFELSLGSVNAAVSDEDVRHGWKAFFEELDDAADPLYETTAASEAKGKAQKEEATQSVASNKPPTTQPSHARFVASVATTRASQGDAAMKGVGTPEIPTKKQRI